MSDDDVYKLIYSFGYVSNVQLLIFLKGLTQWHLVPLWATRIPTTVLNHKTVTTTDDVLDSMDLPLLI